MTFISHFNQETDFVSKENTVLATLTEQGDYLTSIGQLDEAAEHYLQAIMLNQGDKQRIAFTKGQLAMVRFLQQDYSSALVAYQEAKDIFEQLNEPQTVAAAWHQIGVVYTRMQNYEQAEQACYESLKIKNEQGNTADIASTLNQLGNIYDDWGKLEQAVMFYSQAAECYTQLSDKLYEGVTRSNIANSLIQLQRYDEARCELQRALDCKKAFGHNAEPWKTWNILHELEHAIDNFTAAHAAKQQAIESYLIYRRDGGENLSGSPVPEFCLGTWRAIQENNNAIAEKELLSLDGLPDYLSLVVAKLVAILRGERNLSLADDAELDFISTAELLLLLEQLPR